MHGSIGRPPRRLAALRSLACLTVMALAAALMARSAHANAVYVEGGAPAAASDNQLNAASIPKAGSRMLMLLGVGAASPAIRSQRLEISPQLPAQ